MTAVSDQDVDVAELLSEHSTEQLASLLAGLSFARSRHTLLTTVQLAQYDLAFTV